MSASAFTTINLSALPFPGVLETLDFFRISAEQRADLTRRLPGYLWIESDPAVKTLDTAGYREMLLRQRINEAAVAGMPAYALGADLDNLAAFYGVTRLVVTQEDTTSTPPTPAVYESDDALRGRMMLALEGQSTSGPEGSYIFHAMSADGAVRDVLVESPAPAHIAVTVLSHDNEGVPDQALLDKVLAALSATDVRPFGDRVEVNAAVVIPYTVHAKLTFLPGPSHAPVIALAEKKLTEFLDESNRLGYAVTLSGLHAALHQAGVYRVELLSPDPATLPLAPAPGAAAFCTDFEIEDGGDVSL